MRCGVVRIVEGLEDGRGDVQSAVVAHNLHRECYVTGTPVPQSDE